MNPVLVQFINDNMAFVIIAAIALVGAIAAAVLLAVTTHGAKAGKGFFVATKRLAVKYTLTGLLLVVLLFGNFVLYSFSGTITLALCGSGLNVDEKAAAEAQKNSAELCVEIAEDGITLLKNKDNALPLTNNKINVFGWSGSKNGFVHQGAGSGGGTDTDITDLYEGLRKSGMEINEELAAAYNAMPYEREGWAYYKLPEGDEAFYTSERMQNAVNFSDQAIIVLGRKGGETSDLPRYQHVKMTNKKNYDRIYSEISDLEELMIQKVTENFKKVIIVFNTTNVMEAGFIENDKISAAVAMYAPGSKGSPALGNLLMGKANFSGKTVDTWAYDLTTAAAFANAGAEGTHVIKANSSQNAYISNYAEGVYEGYYWYETADKEGFWDSKFAKNRWNIKNGYKDVVQFPFGFGLSYTTFSWELEELELPQYTKITTETEITLKVFVKNTGDKDGKDVVELYCSLPYTKGGIEKPSEKLVGFAKTALLKPGEGEVLSITVKAGDLASYDCYDKNNNGFMGYELEGGNYTFSLKTDAHTLASVGGLYGAQVTCKVDDKGFKIENDLSSGNKVDNKFTTFTNPTSGATSKTTEAALSAKSKAYSVDAIDSPFAFDYLTRADFTGTFPEFSKNVAMSTDFYNETFVANSPLIKSDDVMPKVGSTDTSYKLEEFVYKVTDSSGNPVLDKDGRETYALLDYNDKKWDDLVSQISLEDLFKLSGKGGFGTVAIESIGKIKAVDKDGPCGFNENITGSSGGAEAATNFPCETLIASTWDWKLSYKFGLALGSEANALGVDGLYGPGANIHRNTLNGRNFEYYSEDPFLSGVMCSYTVYGCKEKGLYCWIKHFALNENETGRTHMYQWCNEQALREIYLKPYEIAIKTGGANAIMTSYGRVGSVRASGSSALLTGVLREEWGFKGAVITDYYNGGMVHDGDECIRAGNDLMLEPNGGKQFFDDRTSATAVKALQQSAKHILYCYLDTKYTAQVATGLDLSTVIGEKTEVFPWWIPVVVTLDVILVGCAATYVTLTVIKKNKQKLEATVA